ncbi:hypothetical protein [Acinetobacter shaoyimingii]|uniref:Uncharacterized protein n=1 Tax=Acinetobacter shaoyimingii TaxID=2715164 RepID=A0A6G8RUM0_9GAMM|nr:hypothetical protein [Acinetobacter shaoyimingii]QIO05626.1 hypothetical protein G8E00_06495 [Acinetobacter shaoyimingii]
MKKYNNQIVIREHARFNATPKDLVYVTLDSTKPKSLSKSGAFIVAWYPAPPTKQEMRSDFASVLNQY